MVKYLRQIREAIKHLNPEEVREGAEQPVRIGIVASSEESARAIEEFLTEGASAAKRREQANCIARADGPEPYDIEIYDERMPHPDDAFVFSFDDPYKVITQIVESLPDHGLALARCFVPFRQAVVERITQAVAKENALFSLATALPSIIPNLLWSFGEWASDTAFLTVNQVRMAFLLAAATDRPVGYREQAPEIASIIAAAFGWRALARELVGKIPLGGGLIPKAAIAYAGTYVVGRSIERYYRIGQGYTRDERRIAYEQALARGKSVAGALLEGFRR
jgi:hypothetical protein